MDEYVKKYNNVFWFLIDGLRPDFLHTNRQSGNNNFLDHILSKATVFDHVVTAGSGTRTSMYSIFTSFLPAYNGMTGWDKMALRNFDQSLFTIADYFQLAGYETFRYCDADCAREVPMSGFKTWESSDYKQEDLLSYTNMSQTRRRDRFIESVNQCKKNKFVYHHSLLLHELNNNKLKTFWKSEAYAENVAITAKEFEKIYYEYMITEDDLVIISSDHGVILDKDFVQDGIKNGGRIYEESALSFLVFSGKNMKPQILSNPIASLDILPTLLHIALGSLDVLGQGIDQYNYIYKGKYHENMFFRESGTYNTFQELQNSLTSDVYYVRDGKWKYVFSKKDPRSEWLINLEKDGDYQINRKDEYPELVKKYRQILEDKYNKAEKFQYIPMPELDKKSFPKMFSVILQMDSVEEDTIESLLDMAGPYYEIIVCNSEKMIKYESQYKVRLVETIDSTVINECKGEWIVYIKDNGEWSEYFLSDLYHYIQCHRNKGVEIIGEHYRVVRKEELAENVDIKLYEKNAVRAIRYRHEGNIEKKYILFGCGEIGKSAVDYFGRKNIYCFADNNSNLTGREVCGKKVISFENLKEIQGDYQIVITTKTSYACEIRRQLEKAGISGYLLFEAYAKKEEAPYWKSGYRVRKAEAGIQNRYQSVLS